MEVTIEFNHEILGYSGKNRIFIVGINDDTNEKVIITLKENIYKRGLKEYWKAKKDYCNRYDHFCGVGYFYGDGNIIGELDLFEDIDEMGNTITSKIPVIELNELELQIEHG